MEGFKNNFLQFLAKKSQNLYNGGIMVLLEKWQKVVGKISVIFYILYIKKQI